MVSSKLYHKRVAYMVSFHRYLIISQVADRHRFQLNFVIPQRGWRNQSRQQLHRQLRKGKAGQRNNVRRLIASSSLYPGMT